MRFWKKPRPFGDSERLNKLKHFRAIATRYDKLARNFLAGVQLAFDLILLNGRHALAAHQPDEQAHRGQRQNRAEKQGRGHFLFGRLELNGKDHADRGGQDRHGKHGLLVDFLGGSPKSASVAHTAAGMTRLRAAVEMPTGRLKEMRRL